MNQTLASSTFAVFAALALHAGAPHAAVSEAGSVDCAKASGGIESLICSDTGLAALDRKLVDVYAAATKVASPEQRNRLFAEQQSWLADRNRCGGAKDPGACARDYYARRIADLQAQFKLVASRGPFRFVCDKDPASILTAQYFQTEPPTARFFHDGRTVTAFIARAGSGARYDNPNISYWEHEGEASVVWYGRKLTCSTRPTK
jgi:uncharacterized protein